LLIHVESVLSLTRKLHKLASPVLFLSGAYLRRWRKRASLEPFTVVLAYHRVVADGPTGAGRFDIERGIPASVFEAQIRFMLKYFKPIRASKVLEPSSERLRFAVTLDDGYEDNYLVAFFVISEYAGSNRLFWWEQVAEIIRKTRVARVDFQETVPELVGTDRLPVSLPLGTGRERETAYVRLCAAMRAGLHAALPLHLERLAGFLDVQPREEGRDYGLMNWDQLKELVSQGFEVGGHTATHANVVGLDQEALQTEVVSSFATIERQLETPALTFAYPYGHFQKSDNAAARALETVGCRAAFVGVKGVVEKHLSAFELPRTQLNRRYPFACAYNIQDTLNQC
jgi:peptidoglycan/xylan/chitin deacetylase (PgdA/CDA1 family)